MLRSNFRIVPRCMMQRISTYLLIAVVYSRSIELFQFCFQQHFILLVTQLAKDCCWLCFIVVTPRYIFSSFMLHLRHLCQLRRYAAIFSILLFFLQPSLYRLFPPQPAFPGFCFWSVRVRLWWGLLLHLLWHFLLINNDRHLRVCLREKQFVNKCIDASMFSTLQGNLNLTVKHQMLVALMEKTPHGFHGIAT